MSTSDKTRSAKSRAKMLRHGPAGGDAHHMGRPETVGIEHSSSVGHEVSTVVTGAARFVGGRSARVAVVVTDHEPPTVREGPTELLLPPQHRCAETHDKKNRRIGRFAERLRAQLDLTRFDDALGHIPSLVAASRSECAPRHRSAQRPERMDRQDKARSCHPHRKRSAGKESQASASGRRLRGIDPDGSWRPECGLVVSERGAGEGGDRRRGDDMALRPIVPHLQLDVHLGAGLPRHPPRAGREPGPGLLLDRRRPRR